MKSTRWMWIPSPDGRRVLAFGYVDRSAGESAKGAAVSDAPTPEEIAKAIESPDRTFRDPRAFGAVPIGPEEALRLGLPKDPPWIGFFEDKPIPPPRGEASREVTATVLLAGRPVAGATVQMGRFAGIAGFIALDRRTTDARGRCRFPLAPTPPIHVIADAGTAKSNMTAVAGGEVVLELFACGTLEGEVRRAGELVDAAVRMKARESGLRHSGWSPREQVGKYRIDGIVPGTYDVEVNRLDPSTSMLCGPTTTDTIVVEPGARLRKDYAVAAGATLKVVIAVKNDEENANVMLFVGRVEPRTSTELRALWTSRDPSQYQSANASTNDGRSWRTEFSDLAPGVYTVCVAPSDLFGRGHEEQPVLCREVTIDERPSTIELTMPPLRPR